MAEEPELLNLPGVGARLDVDDLDRRRFSVVRRRDGHVEFHSGSTSVEVDERAARAIGAFVSGRFLMPTDVTERVDGVLGGLTFDYVTIRNGSAAVSRSIEELAVRRRTGVTIVAILRGSVPLVAPDPATRLANGDDLVVAGRPSDVERFDRYLATGVI